MNTKDWLKHPEQKYISQGAKDLIRPEETEPEQPQPQPKINTKCITTKDVYGIFEEMGKDIKNGYHIPVINQSGPIPIDVWDKLEINKDIKNSCRITTVNATGKVSISEWNIVKVIK